MRFCHLILMVTQRNSNLLVQSDGWGNQGGRRPCSEHPQWAKRGRDTDPVVLQPRSAQRPPTWSPKPCMQTGLLLATWCPLTGQPQFPRSARRGDFTASLGPEWRLAAQDQKPVPRVAAYRGVGPSRHRPGGAARPWGHHCEGLGAGLEDQSVPVKTRCLRRARLAPAPVLGFLPGQPISPSRAHSPLMPSATRLHHSQGMPTPCSWISRTAS